MEFNKTITFYIDQAEVTFADNTNPGDGTTAYNQFLAKKTIHAISSFGDTYIPFHAIRKALLAVEGVEKDITDDVCDGGSASSLCDHETIEVYPTDYETPLPWWEERITIGISGHTDVGFTSIVGGDTIQNFTASIDKEDIATVETVDDGYGNNKLRITNSGSQAADATVTVNFPDYGCELTIMIHTEGSK